MATIDAPHLLILDEPTNHLDMESREALVEALTAYAGAVVIVSHDMHLLNLVADRLWLVKDGRVQPFDGDLDAYRRILLEQPPKKPAQSPNPKAVPREDLKALKAEVATCEARVAKIEAMREKLSVKLADPAVYETNRMAETVEWQKKFAEIEDGLARAEALWIAAVERLEAAEAAKAS